MVTALGCYPDRREIAVVYQAQGLQAADTEESLCVCVCINLSMEEMDRKLKIHCLLRFGFLQLWLMLTAFEVNLIIT